MKKSTSAALSLFLICTGCHRAGHNSSLNRERASAPVYNSSSEKSVNNRAAELQRAGHSPEAAQRKARAEAAQHAWQEVSGTDWVTEQQRAERSRNRESMEKALSKLGEK